MRTRILIGLFTVLMLGASCTTAQNSKETFYDKVLSLNLDDEMLRDDGTTLKIAKLAPQQFRLRVCKGDKLLFVTWVELRAVENTINNRVSKINSVCLTLILLQWSTFTQEKPCNSWALSLITEEDRKNPRSNAIIKAYDRALMGNGHIFGWYFAIQTPKETIYSSLYPSEEYAAQIRDGLLRTINQITAELPKVTI